MGHRDYVQRVNSYHNCYLTGRPHLLPGANSYHSCYSTAILRIGKDGADKSTLIIVVTQPINTGFRESKMDKSTLIIVVTQPTL